MALIIFGITHKLIVKCFDTVKVRYIVLPYNYMFSFCWYYGHTKILIK
jgi:hypothetical protein